MHVHQEESWEAKAKAKVAETKSKIPNEWRLNQTSLDKAKKIKKLSGAFIESFLSAEELSITGNDSTLLVEKVKTGEYTALQVAQAFCKTAAVAHQIVGIISYVVQCLLFASFYPPRILLTTIANPLSYRTIVFTKSFSNRRCREQRS